ncbi:MAG: exosortase system-associated protein, TIGR04073 family [Candidatus Hydrogenedentales bacterium]
MSAWRKPWLSSVCVVLIAAVMLIPAVSWSQSYDPDDEIRPPTGFEKRLTKLGRGLSNVLLGWAEIPVTFDRKLKEGKPLGYLLGVVPVLGTTRAVLRTGTGVYEMFTFPVSDKEVNFDPILEPEYIF